MRRARGLRVSPSRNVCVFCASRQLVADVSPALSQRRLLNSTTKTPQYAADQVYKEEAAPPRRMTMAEKFQQQQQAMLARQQPPQPRPDSQAQRMGSGMQSQYSSRTIPQQEGRSPPWRTRSGVFVEPRNGQSNERYAPGGGNKFGDAPRQNKYRVNMDSRPPVGNTLFGSTEHLRRRNEPRRDTVFDRADTKEFKPTQNVRPSNAQSRLGQEELDRLLGNQKIPSKEPPKPYAPLSERKQMKCFVCKSTEHWSADCPNQKSVNRTPMNRTSMTQAPTNQPPLFPAPMKTYSPNRARKSGSEGSLVDAAESWIQRAGSLSEEHGPSPATQHEEEGKWRRGADTFEKKRSRFAVEDEALTQTRNRYEEPLRRRRGGQQNKGRGRAMWNQDEEDAPRLDKEERKRRKEAKKAALAAKAGPTPIYLPAYISVANLATMLKLRVEDFVRKLEELGFEEVQTDHVLNAEHAGLVAQEYNFEPIVQAEGEDQDLYPAPPLSPEDYAQLPSRPPVVTIMGHVDHGKTTILDYMRKSSVAATEFGGITQHIGAFSVPLASGSNITFLDTPGHAAFETMRARGANVTDIVVLVVAADDSVMPQTVEAIKHAQAARVPIIVAINKIDKQQADPERVKGDLGRHGIEVEDYGGDTQTVCVSGVTGQGISDLEEAISLQSEMLDHRADPKSNMEGWVLEGATKDRGKVATILVRSGTLRKGDVLVAGTTWARVRTLRNEAGVIVEEVGPGMPVEVDGWREQPIAGDEVLQASDEQQASSVAELRVEKVERERMAKDMDAVNESRRKETERREAERQAEEAAALALKNGEEVVPEEPKQESGPEIISFIVKGDVSGSVEAVIDSISAIGNNEVGTRILRHGVGAPSEFDVQHAADAKGHIVNFNTAIPSHIASMAEHLGVKILDSNIIYRVVENIKALLSEKLSDKITQRVTGEAEVAAVFDIGLGGRKKMKVAGSKVRNGIVEKGSKVKVLRGDKVVYTGTLSSLKNVKKDVESMRKDTECGIAFEGWEDFLVGDKVQTYDEKSEKRYL